MLPLALVLAVVSGAPRAPQAKPPPKGGAAVQLPSVEAAFLHDLSTPNGRSAMNWPALAYDREHQEIFVVAEGFVRIYDGSGMEVHRFGDDGSIGAVTRAVPLEDGELVVLTTLNGAQAIIRCDFRGEPLATITLTGLPDAFARFQPDQLVQHDGRLYFAERGTMRVVVTDVSGVYRDGYNLRDVVAAALPPDGEQKPPGAMDGFAVDAAGNILFTMSTMFSGALLTPNGELRTFGSRGSTPGRFNIIGGIDADEAGNLYISDRLRSVVSVWDRQLRFLGEFGYRGDDPSNLLTPFEVAVGKGKVFVAQAGKRGVKVFRVKLIEPEPPPETQEQPAQETKEPPPALRERWRRMQG